MRATYLYGPGDVRVIDVPDPTIQQPTKAIVRVVRRAGLQTSCVHGGFWNDPALGTFGSLFGGNVTLTGGPAPARAYIERLLPGVALQP